MARIEPGDPVNSYVMHKLDGTQTGVGGTGSQMPLASAGLSQEERDGIRGWVAAGAMLNGFGDGDDDDFGDDDDDDDFGDDDDDDEIGWFVQAMGSHLFDVHFTDTEHGWAVGHTGALVRTTDGGQTWLSVDIGEVELEAIHFNSQFDGWAVGAAGLILHTVDGGESWTTQQSNTNNNLFDVYFNSAVLGWAVGANGTILGTLNGGSSWLTLSTGLVSSQLQGVAFNGSNGVVAGSDGSILLTPDSGITWTSYTVNNAPTFRAVEMTDAMVAVAVGNGGIVATADLDFWPPSEFTVQSTNTSDDLQSVHFYDHEKGWATGNNGALLTTVDGGFTWNSESSGTQVILEGVHFVTPETGWAVGYEGTILHSDDAGETWTSQMNWALQDIQGDLGSITFIDENTGWVVGSGGVILKTSDGGTTWQQQTSGTSENLTDVLFTSATHGWAVGAGGTLQKTVNGGTTWTTGSSGTTERLRSLSAADNNTLGAVGDASTFVSSSDGGVTWALDESPTAEDKELWDLFALDNEHVWCVGVDGGIWASFDSPWAQQNSAVSASLRSVHFTDEMKGWAVGRLGTITGTVDGGNTWQEQSSGTSEHFRSVVFADHVTGWAVGDSGTIRATKDGGTTWSPQLSGTSRDLRSVTFIDAFRGWAVGDHGTILATLSGGGPLDSLPGGDDDDAGDDDDDGPTTCEGSYTVDGTDTAADLSAISDCAVITGSLIIQQTNRNQLNPLSNLTEVGGNLIIAVNNQLETLAGLDQLETVEGMLELSGNQVLTSLEALGQLTFVGGALYIDSSEQLTDLDGLDNLQSIGTLEPISGAATLSIIHMDNLTHLDGLAAVNSVNGDVTISYNGALCSANVNEFVAACGLTGSATTTDNDGACPNDGDGDGWLDGVTGGGTDCDDNEPLINPAATEVCNGLDDDCDAFLDETGGPPWYLDADGDGLGDSNGVIYPCDSPGPGYVTDGGDCNDLDSGVLGPDAWYQDSDNDGFGNPSVTETHCNGAQPPGWILASLDCNDLDASINPDATDGVGDGIDQNCDGWDGVAAPVVVIEDLDGSDPNPGPVVPDDNNPNTIYTTDQFQVLVVSDAAESSWTVAWYVDGATGTPTSLDHIISASQTTRDETWLVEVSIQGLPGQVFTASASITILNTLPSVSEVTLSPAASVTEASTLVCADAVWADPDSDPQNYIYIWTITDPDGTQDFQDGEEDCDGTCSTLDGTWFNRADTVQCSLTPNDGTHNGFTVNSNAVVVENSPPTIAAPSIKPVPVYADTPLWIEPGAITDLDPEDELTWTATWTVNPADNTGPASYSTVNLDPQYFSAGDQITVSLTPEDYNEVLDEGTSGAVSTSDLVEVANKAPGAPLVGITRRLPHPDDGVQCVFEGFANDVDTGDSVSHTLEAFNAAGTSVGLTNPLYVGETLVLTDANQGIPEGEQWTCRATANDGTQNGQTAEASATFCSDSFLPFTNDGVEHQSSDEQADTWVEVPGHEAFAFGTAGTLEAWIYWGDVNQGGLPSNLGGWIVNRWADGDCDLRLELGSNGLLYSYYLDTNGITQELTSGSSQVVADAWTHVALVWDAVGANLLVDGAVVHEGTGLQPPDSCGNSATPLWIGGSEHDIGSELSMPPMPGFISDVRLSDSALYDGSTSPQARLPVLASTQGLWRLEAGVSTSSFPNAVVANEATGLWYEDTQAVWFGPSAEGYCRYLPCATIDADGDGQSACNDCDDANPNQYPGNTDQWGDVIDEDCDGLDCQTLDSGTTRFALCAQPGLDGHSWAEAQDLCLSAGYDGLASILTPNENEGVTDQLMSLRDNADPSDAWLWDAAWLGLNELLSPGNWGHWPDGTLLDEHMDGNPVPWLPDQPDDYGTVEDCLVLQEPQGWPSPGWPYTNWNDVICSSFHSFVCMSR